MTGDLLGALVYGVGIMAPVSSLRDQLAALYDTSGPPAAPARLIKPQKTTPSKAAVVRAPDGMEMEAPSVKEPQSLQRAQIIQAAKKAGVPQREQIGFCCGLYALGMVMDFWHAKDSRNITAWVQNQDAHGQGIHFNFPPNTDENILDYALHAGFTSQGEMYTARQLAQTAAHFGYKASVHHHATLEDLYNVLDKGHPAIVAFDVDRKGNPGTFGGMRAHYAVIEGYFDEGGERYLVARHGWNVEEDHVWLAKDLDRSWKALQTTDYYGTPGDGVIPDRPDLTEQAHLDLPDAGNGLAGIRESLGTKIVEVVPCGESLVGGETVAPPG